MLADDPALFSIQSPTSDTPRFGAGFSMLCVYASWHVRKGSCQAAYVIQRCERKQLQPVLKKADAKQRFENNLLWSGVARSAGAMRTVTF